MQKLERLLQLHKKSKYKTDKFIKSLRGLGFKNVVPDRHNVYVFIKPYHPFVVKVQKSVCPIDGVPPKGHVLYNHYVHPDYEKHGVRIQKKLTLRNIKKAFSRIQYTIKLSEDELAYHDVHPWNVGWKNGEALIFDCLP